MEHIDFEIITSSDYCESIFDGTHDSPKYHDDGFPLVTSKCILNNRIDSSIASLISKPDYDLINKRSKVEQFDILISMIGVNAGIVGFINNKPNYAIKNVGVFRCKNELDSKYLFYLLQSEYGKSCLKSSLAGSAQPYITLDKLRTLELLIPTQRGYQQHIVNTIGSVDDLIENYQERIYKIADILSKSLERYPNKTTIDYYQPFLIKSGIDTFDNEKEYLDTSSVEGINSISGGEIITYGQRPSRANMQPIPDSVWFAKMKGSYKNIVIGKSDIDIIENNILSTGFQGIKVSKRLPLSLLTAFIISKNFNSQRDLNSVGTTMAGINNETFMKINVPLLSESEIIDFDNKNKSLVDELSILRRKINSLKQIKSLLLSKYF